MKTLRKRVSIAASAAVLAISTFGFAGAVITPEASAMSVPVPPSSCQFTANSASLRVTATNISCTSVQAGQQYRTATGTAYTDWGGISPKTSQSAIITSPNTITSHYVRVRLGDAQGTLVF